MNNFRKKIKSPVIELRIEKMVQGAFGLARLRDGRVCFVEGALPGELCKVMLSLEKKDFTRGRVIEIIEASKDRVKPKCPMYGRCGGCSLQHLESEKQHLYLEQVERENFRRLAHAELPLDFKIHTGKSWGYRNRARVVFSDKQKKFGFREQESNNFVWVENCPVLTPALNDFLNKVIAENLFAFVHQKTDVNIFDNGKGEISYYYRGMPADRFYKHAISVVEIDGKCIESDASVFFQSNLSLLPELVDSVKKAVDEGLENGESSNEWLIDLFSGVGFFATLLADRFKRVTTVERDEGCLKHANVNLSIKGKNHSKELKTQIENVFAKAEEWLVENVVDVPATLIVDPPRTGLPKEALDAIIKSSVNRLIYVSCNPVTLARDYAKFATAGFILRHAEGFAFYPQTPHLEMMFVMSRE